MTGELERKITGSDTTRYTYDALGNLLGVQLPGGTVVEYVVDGRQRRVGKKVNGTVVQGFLYLNQLGIIGELNAGNELVSQFVYGTRLEVPDYMIRGGRTYRIIADHVGSVRLVVDVQSGVVAQRLDYDEFGRVITNTNPGFQPFGFAGGLYDEQTGLTRFGFRDYDALTGRWTARDPILFAGGTPNLYLYGVGDPINFADPWGLQTNPTCGRIRGTDRRGSGAFRAPRRNADRTTREHAGVDYAGPAGGAVVAPLSGQLQVNSVTSAWITTDPDENGVRRRVKLFHVNQCYASGTRRRVREGEIIGTVEDLATSDPRRYRGITPHAHLELYEAQSGGGWGGPVDPTDIFGHCQARDAGFS